MTIVDWRQVDSRALALVFARERARWLVDLGWETREAWLHVEHARTTWGLPGLAAIDDGGRVRGLTFFHQTRSRFDIGGVFAESATVRDLLLDAALAACEDAGGDEIATFLYAGAINSLDSLVARDFTVEPFDYLSLQLGASPSVVGSADPQIVVHEWRPDSIGQVAELLNASYVGPAARRFVPDQTVQGWRHYVDAMIQHHACGTLLPSATRLAFMAELLVGVVLVTELGAGTAHLAQVVVHPQWRQRGLAGELIDEAARRAHRLGYSRVTLLASSQNGPAQALYRKRGYTPSARFVAAVKPLHAKLAARAS